MNIDLFYDILNDQDKYIKIHFKKKSSGGYREIIAPLKSYKDIQTEIYKNFQSKNILPNHELSFAWANNKDRVKCLEPHIENDYIMESDVNNYFGNIGEKHLTMLFKKYKVSFDERITQTDLINFLTLVRKRTMKRFLPQGFVTSPIIANAVRYDMDVVLAELAEKRGLTITYYGDNIVTSCNEKDKLKKFKTIINDIYGFNNFKVKHKIYPYFKRQKVLGFIINEKFNMDRRYYLDLLKELYTTSNNSKVINRSLEGKIALLRLNDNLRDYNYVINFINKHELKYESKEN